MKYQSLFSGENKKKKCQFTSELAENVIKVNESTL